MKDSEQQEKKWNQLKTNKGKSNKHASCCQSWLSRCQRGYLKEWRLEMKIHVGRKNTTIAQQMSRITDLDSGIRSQGLCHGCIIRILDTDTNDIEILDWQHGG